jgi:trans-2,3-dihydro-3-hydroxyanthranilate isomerase
LAVARTLDYDIVDVFTSQAFAGNPLAVVHGADDLSDEQMHALAREFHLSETTFPGPSRGDGDYHVRIFTPGGEIPFAGHPTLGTAWVLRKRGRLDPGTVVQECGAGLVTVQIPPDPASAIEFGASPRDLPVEVEAEPLAAAAGLAAGDVTGPVFAAGCGLTFVHLPVRPEALVRAVSPRPDDPVVLRGLPGLRDPVGGIDVYVAERPSARSGPTHVRCRVFCPEVVVAEDPATGSSAAGLGLVLHEREILPDDYRYAVTQGVEIGRPSRLFGWLQVGATGVERCHVSGGVVPVASGRIAVPGAQGR